MFARLLLLFTVVPAVELFLLIKLGELIGAFETVLIILVTGSVGAWLAKREGLGVIRALQEEALSGLPPGGRIVEGLMVLVGGALLITPGVLTDLTGFLLIMPWSRRFMAPRIQAWATRRILAGGGSVQGDFMGASVRVDRPQPGRPRTREPLRPAPTGGSTETTEGPGAFGHPTPSED